MSLNRVRERIIEKANFEASKIIEEAKLQLEKEKNNFQKEEELKFEEYKRKAFLELENQYKMKLDVERINLGKAILIEKRNILDELFEKVKAGLLSLNSEKYLKFLVHLIKRDAPNGNSKIFLNKKDLESYGKKLGILLKKELGGDKECVISDKSVEIIGGCIIRGKEIEINDSIEVIVGDLQEKYEIEISKELFIGNE